MAELPHLRADKRDMIMRPPLDQCSTGHRLIFYSKSATCPLCGMKGYYEILNKRADELMIMVRHIKNMFFTDE